MRESRWCPRESGEGNEMKIKKIFWLPPTVLIALLILVIIVPLLIGNRHPKPGPESEAWTNLNILRLLQEEYRAVRGRYAPDPDGTAYYRTGDTTVQKVFPDFRPGSPKTLNFDYVIISSGNGVRFIAVAAGKKGTVMSDKRFSIDQDGVKNW